MAYEFRGSMVVYLTLLATSSFTPSWRRATIIFLTAYSICLGNLLGDVPFCSGMLLADLSIVITKRSNSHSGTINPRSGLLSLLKNSWAILLALVALVICSFPPEGGQDLATWSQFLDHCADLLFPPHCTNPIFYPILMEKG